MRIAILIGLCVVIAGCSRIDGGATLPSGSSSAAAQSYRLPANVAFLTLYSFQGQTSGGEPESNLINVDGTLYGTASSYGAGYGTVFAISPFGKLRVLHKFQGSLPDGAYPEAGLVAVDGVLYGTTSGGGAHGSGTVFAVTRSGAERIVHSFGRAGDGADPESRLIAVDGLLYGTTLDGGTHSRGTVFELSASGQEHVLHSFEGAPTDGGHPSAGLIFVKGWLYGATRAGGKVEDGGAIYKINAFGEEKVLHAFGVRGGDGMNPAGTLLYEDGAFYGTTLHGGTVGGGLGTVFEMAPGGSEIVLHSFGSGTDGAFPGAGLVKYNSAFYGTTIGGGVSPHKSSQCISSGVTKASGYYRCGTIFKIDAFGRENVVYRFAGDPEGANPEAALTSAGGALYGTTFWGGSANYYGTVFRLQP